jgi:hypothetical protein
MSRIPAFVVAGLVMAGLAVPSVAPAQRARAYYLSNRPVTDSANADAGSVDIAGNTYTRSVAFAAGQPGDAFAEYNLRGRCTRLTFVAGVLDDQDPGDAASFSVDGDDNELTAFDTDFGTPVPQTISVRGVRVLTLSADDLSGTGPLVAFGNARIVCRRRI